MSALFIRFVLWLKKIFRIRPGPKYKSKEPPVEILSGQKPVEIVQASEEKPIEATFPEEKTPEISDLEGGEPTDIKIERAVEESDTGGETLLGENDKGKSRKPYKKRVPIEERKGRRRKASLEEKKSSDYKQKEQIYLGSPRRKKKEPHKLLQPAFIDKKTDKIPAQKRIVARIESPFLEIDFYEAKVFLVLPEQQLKSEDETTVVPRQLIYALELNGEEQVIPVKLGKDGQRPIKAEEKRIELEKPLNSLSIVFPDELQGKTYRYNHRNENLYVFAAIGNNLGRMHYLYDEKGNVRPFPKRDVCILLKENFELGVEPDVKGERWMWGSYQPLHINLKKMDEVTIKNTKTGKNEKMSCETTFSIEGEQIDDDFKEQMPLLVGKGLNIEAPMENPSGWTVWIQNKHAGYRIAADSWTGVDALRLKLPDDLPCECGEFQIDICERDGRVLETLFFRYIPFIRLVHNKELIVPDIHQGHCSETIEVVLGDDFKDWELNAPKKTKLKETGYQLEVPPEEDVLRFSIAKRFKPETAARIRITVPRLKWMSSKQETWSDKVLQIKRDELVRGTDLYCFLSTNDFNTKYDISAILEANRQKVHEEKFIRKAMIYTLQLNRFFDTITKNKDKIILKVEIRKARSTQLLGEVEIINFSEMVKEKPEAEPEKSRVKSYEYLEKGANIEHFEKIDIKDIRPNVKCARGMKKGRGFSKQEIIGAEIDMCDARAFHIPFDKRRKSAHSQNIETLRTIKGGE